MKMNKKRILFLLTGISLIGALTLTALAAPVPPEQVAFFQVSPVSDTEKPAAEGSEAEEPEAQLPPADAAAAAETQAAPQDREIKVYAGGPVLFCSNLTFSGETYVSLGSAFDPLRGVSARTVAGRNLTDRIAVTGEVDTSTAGDYVIVYTVTDDVHRTATERGVVHVIAPGELRFTQGTNALLTEQFPAPPFQTNGRYTDMVGIRVGGVYLTDSQYVAVPAGSFGTYFYFNAEYSRGLPVGQYLLEAVYRNGICGTMITVEGRTAEVPPPATPTDLIPKTDGDASQETAGAAQAPGNAEQAVQAGGQTAEVNGQTAEVSGQAAEVNGQTAEVGGQTNASDQTQGVPDPQKISAVPNTGAAL